MKTSDEIKRGLECLVCYGLGCDGECDTCPQNTEYMGQEGLMQAALEYIQQLEKENKQLKSANIVLTAKAALTDEAVEAGAKAQKELEQLKRERDAIFSAWQRFAFDGESLCWTCKHCEDGMCTSFFASEERDCWEWRGVPQEGKQ